MAYDYIPRADAEFNLWSQKFVNEVFNWWPTTGRPLTDLDALLLRYAAWQSSWGSYNTAQAAVASALEAKRDAREGFSPEIRTLAQFIQEFKKTTDATRCLMGLPVRDGEPLGPGTITSPPRVRIEHADRLTHTLRVTDSATATKRAKPRGALGAEVWVALAPPHAPAPTSIAEYRYINICSGGSMTLPFTSADAGKTACYQLRWRDTRGGVGPWSDVATATVAA